MRGENGRGPGRERGGLNVWEKGGKGMGTGLKSSFYIILTITIYKNIDR